MSSYLFTTNVKDHAGYRASFFELAMLVFDLDFRAWYTSGGWNEHYRCYAYVDQGKVIANASVNKMTIASDGQFYTAIQIGTVMTHPDYRNQGLSGKLMQHILDEYENRCDFIFLFANETVHDFYPKFGFQRVKESSFSLPSSLHLFDILSRTSFDTESIMASLMNEGTDIIHFTRSMCVSRSPRMLDGRLNVNKGLSDQKASALARSFLFISPEKASAFARSFLFCHQDGDKSHSAAAAKPLYYRGQ